VRQAADRDLVEPGDPDRGLRQTDRAFRHTRCRSRSDHDLPQSFPSRINDTTVRPPRPVRHRKTPQTRTQRPSPTRGRRSASIRGLEKSKSEGHDQRDAGAGKRRTPVAEAESSHESSASADRATLAEPPLASSIHGATSTSCSGLPQIRESRIAHPTHRGLALRTSTRSDPGQEKGCHCGRQSSAPRLGRAP